MPNMQNECYARERKREEKKKHGCSNTSHFKIKFGLKLGEFARVMHAIFKNSLFVFFLFVFCFVFKANVPTRHKTKMLMCRRKTIYAVKWRHFRWQTWQWRWLMRDISPSSGSEQAISAKMTEGNLTSKSYLMVKWIEKAE